MKLSDLGMAHSHLEDDGDGKADSFYADDDDGSNPSCTPRSSGRSCGPSAASAPATSGNASQFQMPSTTGQSAPPGTGRAGDGAGGHLIGTPGYVAPEVIRRLPGANAPPSDMWSAGVVLYILLSGKMPFYGRNDAECLARTASGSYTMPAREWSRVSPAAVSLVRGMLCVDPSKRLTATAALQHPWLASPSTLSASPLDNNLSGLHSSRRKFRRAVMACITMQRMQRAVAAGKASSSAASAASAGSVVSAASSASAAPGGEGEAWRPARGVAAAPPTVRPLPRGVAAAPAVRAAPAGSAAARPVPRPPSDEGSGGGGGGGRTARGGVAAPPTARPRTRAAHVSGGGGTRARGPVG